jgi:hypothetical protein
MIQIDGAASIYSARPNDLLGRAVGDGQLGQPVARRSSGVGNLLATRIVHGFQGGFAPLLKQILPDANRSGSHPAAWRIVITDSGLPIFSWERPLGRLPA